jgi:hypothetical protein
MRLGITPRHCSTNSHGEAIPATVRRCAAWPATTPWHCATHSCTDDAPHPRKRTVEPSKGRRTTTPRPHKDNIVTSGRRDRSPPSPSVLCDHPRHPQHHPGNCITIPNTVGGRGDKTPPRRLLCRATRRRHAGCCAPRGLLSTAPSSPCTGDDQTGDPYNTTLEAAPGWIQGPS